MKRKKGLITAAVLLTICLPLFPASACGDTSYMEDRGTVISGKTDEYSEDDGTEDETYSEEASVSEEEPLEEICAEVAGAVNRPGVFTVPEGTRVYSLIEKAGGFSADADTTDINQAALASDGQKIYVFRNGERDIAVSPGASAPGGTTFDGRVNINTASKDELMTLSGIGEAKAGAIIAYREKHGPFDSVDSLSKVSGIKGGTIEKIKDSITV